MPGSIQKTEMSKPEGQTNAKLVIEFKTPPTYRNCKVDLSKSSKIELKKIINYNNKIRAVVPNMTQISGQCKVILNDCEYIVHDLYSGTDVSQGIIEVC